tara:strand:- start:303 stop:920 length:618 start_codon:yes stop_codon:yes gene_type:complete
MIKLNYIDLGFHEGQEIGLVLDHYEDYKDKFDLTIYGVEAYTPFFTKLKQEYEDNDRVKLFNNAITDKIGFTELYISGGKKYGSSLFSSKRNVNPKSKQLVYGYTFSEFVSKNVKHFESSVNVLKLNIEGSELSVYEDLIKTDMLKDIDLFCGHPVHDIEKIPELTDKKDRYYSLMNEHNIKLEFLCCDDARRIASSINIFEAIS